MPELSDALHELFDEESRVYATPSRGLSPLAATTRKARRRALARTAALGGVGVIAVVGLVFGTVRLVGPDAVPPAAPPSPSLVAVAWDPAPDFAAAAAGLPWPECGEEWAPAAQAVNGITPVVITQESFAEPDEPLVEVGLNFDYGDGEPTPLLYVAGMVVVTRDGEVVLTRDYSTYAPDHQWLELWTPGDTFEYGWVGLWGSKACAARAEGAEQAGGDSPSLPPGTYQVYVVTPIILGENAAVASRLTEQGLESTNLLTWRLGASEFANDPRIAPYCALQDNGSGEFETVCEPPADVLKEVLTRDVDPAAVVDVPPGVGISEPLELVIE